jgi:hypothetical protein
MALGESRENVARSRGHLRPYPRCLRTALRKVPFSPFAGGEVDRDFHDEAHDCITDR